MGITVDGRPEGPWAKYAPAPASAPWLKYKKSDAAQPNATATANAKQPISTLRDVAESLPSGVASGAAEMAMLPVTAHRALGSGMDYVMGKGDDLARYILGMDPASPELQARRQEGLSKLDTPIDQAINSTQDQARQLMADTLHKPETTAGRLAYTLGQFAVPGALPSKAALAATGAARVGQYASDFIGNTVAPALVSEGAGKLAEGTRFEPAARIAGAVAGNAGTAFARAYNAPEAAVRRAVDGMTPEQWQAAKALHANTTGVRLTGPEAIAQATGGASALPNLQRVVEGSVNGQATMGPFFAQRPGQVDTAVGNVLDQIAPQATQPSVLGPRAAEAAGTVIDQTRQAVNTATRPLYQAAEPQLVPSTALAASTSDPSFQAAVARLRGDPELGPRFAGQPDNSVAVVDAVSKNLLDRGQRMSTSNDPLYGRYLGSLNTTAGEAARTAARNAVPEYDAALLAQQQLRRDQLQPVEAGPIGGVAAATDTATAGGRLLPQNPLVGSGNEIADAVTRLAAQDSETTAGLVRQTLSDRYNRVSTETQGADRQFAGAKFHKDVAGNPARREALDAALGALPTNQASLSMPELLDVLQATSRRKPVGSATAFNQAEQARLSTGTPLAQTVDVVRSLGTNLITRAGDATKRLALHNSLQTLSKMFAAPNSVDLLQSAVNSSGKLSREEAVLRSLFQAPAIAYDPRRQ